MQPLRADDGNILVSPERVLRESHQRVTRVSVLDSLWTPLPEAVLTGEDGFTISGSVSQDGSRSTLRTLSMSIANPDGVWTPNGPGSFFYWDRMIRVERGVVVGGVPFYASLGVFLIDSPSVSNGTMTITGADRMDRATGSEFTAPTTYAAGASVGETLKAILVDAGVGADRWTIDDNGTTLGAARYYEIGDGRMQAALDLAAAFALDLYSDANGYMVVRPKPNPNGQAVAWTFAPGDEATHLGVSKTWSRDRFYNHILVTGENADQNPVRAEAFDTNPASPTRITGPMGDRLFKYTSAMITTIPQAQAVANALLIDHALIEETISVPHVANPLLEWGDVIHVTDADSLTDDNYVIASINIPIAAGEATLNVKKLRSLL